MSNITNNSFFEQIKNLIEQTKNNVAISVNSSLTMMYWEIGNRINQNILKNQRAEYGKEIVVTLSRQLQDNFGKGFDEKNLRRMIRIFGAIGRLWLESVVFLYLRFIFTFKLRSFIIFEIRCLEIIITPPIKYLNN